MLNDSGANNMFTFYYTCKILSQTAEARVSSLKCIADKTHNARKTIVKYTQLWVHFCIILCC